LAPDLARSGLTDLRVAGTVGAMSKPLGPYTPAVRAGDLIFVSGQLGMLDGALVDGGVAAQAAQAVANLADRLQEMGADLADVVKTTCFLVDMDAFATFNAAYVEAFGGHRPARSTIAVRELPADGQVEIEAVAYRAQG
jgi:2-iminobutanoate/2-iminopropanoate deaminase